ncbi:Synaptobrevin family protein [Tritrichomonas foetus]|uniref:Synaptobrevin family protein n=1 Tax=Tritrichomonas foetus TaxID=1144522 RepID=A0A1J4JTB8_9EUKA|nr:Synaptobrevin family protein [Tritrichomonas foetus]|eukprot:OHT02369.1 Synaptobrevin family protein [Tritrichomonas foetus]
MVKSTVSLTKKLLKKFEVYSKFKMSIVFTAVSRNNVLIATHSSTGVNLTREIQRLISTPFSKNEQRRTRNYLFTFNKGPLLDFICASPIDVDKSVPISYLELLSNRWNAVLSDKSQNAGPNELSIPYRNLFEATINEFNSTLSKTEKIRRDLDKTQQIVTESLHSALGRGESLNSLNAKSENLLATSDEFKSQATNLKNKMMCARIKSGIFYFCGVMLLVYIVLAFLCGGWRLRPRCFKE